MRIAMGDTLEHTMALPDSKNVTAECLQTEQRRLQRRTCGPGPGHVVLGLGPRQPSQLSESVEKQAPNTCSIVPCDESNAAYSEDQVSLELRSARTRRVCSRFLESKVDCCVLASLSQIFSPVSAGVTSLPGCRCLYNPSRQSLCETISHNSARVTWRHQTLEFSPHSPASKMSHAQQHTGTGSATRHMCLCCFCCLLLVHTAAPVLQ